MIRVLFVCLGNICRSPMAEAVFLHRVREAGLEGKIEADSAGTGDWHIGQPPHPNTRRILAQNGIPCRGCARLLLREDLDAFDYVVTMDDENLRDVRAVGTGRATVAPLMDYAPQAGVREVPDPYYSGNYTEVFALVKEATAGLLAAIREAHGW